MLGLGKNILKVPRLFYKQKHPYDNLNALAQNLIPLLKIPVSRTSIKKKLYSHPDYPTALALIDCLFSWNVKSLLIKLPREKLSLLKLPVVAHINKNGGHFVIILELTSTHLSILDPAIGVVNYNIENFFLEWEGVLLLIEMNEFSGEYEYSVIRKQEFKKYFSWILLLILIALSIALIELLSQDFTIIAILQLIGLGVCVLLKNRKTENNIIRDQKHFKKNYFNFDIFSFLDTWFIIFLGKYITILISLSVYQGLNLLSLFSFISLSSIFFTILLVFKDGLKRISTTQLGVLAIILIESFFLFPFFYDPISLFSFAGIAFLIGFGISIICNVLLFQPLSEINKENKLLKKQLLCFKKKDLYFSSSLKPILQPINFEPKIEFAFGNKKKQKELIVLICLSCSTCERTLDKALAFRLIHDDLYLRVCLSLKKDDIIHTEVAKGLLYLLKKRGKNEALQALISWYKIKKFFEWERKYNIPNILDFEDAIQFHINWCESLNLTYTPALILDGHIVSSDYNINDLSYYLRK